MREVRQREPRLVIPALTKLAEGMPCMVRSLVCNGRTDTTVWAHSNLGRHGKGVGEKSHDIFGCFACSSCHDWLDKDARMAAITRVEREEDFMRAFERTLYYLWANGLITVRR